MNKTNFLYVMMATGLLTMGSCVSKKEYSSLSTKYSDLDASCTALNTQYDELLKRSEQDKLTYTQLQQMYDQVKNKVNYLEKSQQQLLGSIKEALVGFNASDLSASLHNDGKVYVSLSENLLFKSGSYNVDPKGKEALEKLAEVLRQQKDIDIVVEGHTDTVPLKRGNFIKDNMDLSVMRATSIVKLLVDEYNVNPKQLSAAGRGEYFPVASNSTPEGRSQNRRTEIILSPKISEVLEILQEKQVSAK